MLELHQQQQQQQQQQQPTTQHIQQLQYPLPHHVPGSTQPHPLSHTSPHLTPSPTNRMMLRRYSPLCLHMQLNEHQKRKKEKRERRQERRAEKKRLAEHEMALRIQMERESDESAIAREIARIEQSQLSQRGQTPATRQVQQSLTATLASPTYTNALMMQLEKLSGAQRIQHTTETTHIQQQQHNNPAAALPPRPSNKYSPTSTSPAPTTPTLHPTAHSPSALPVSSCPLPNSSFHLSTSNVSTQHIPAPLNPSLMSNTPTPHSPPSFRPVTSTTEMPTTSPGSHQRQLLTHDPESTSPSLTSRFLLANLSKHEKHEYSYSPSIPQIHDDECVELMDCSIEDIPTHEEEDTDETPMSLSQAMTSPPLSDHSSPAVMSETTSPSSKSLFSSFQHLLIHEHDEHEYETTHTSFHVPHASYVSFGKEMV